MKRYSAKLKSTSPISSAVITARPSSTENPTRTTKNVNWRERLHSNAKGNVLIPLFAFKNALDAAAKYESRKIPGRRNAHIPNTFESGVMVENAVVLPIKKKDVKGEWRFVPSDGVAAADEG